MGDEKYGDGEVINGIKSPLHSKVEEHKQFKPRILSTELVDLVEE
jgi:hypothetical protein